jgi:hypothetical protein
MVDKTSFSNLSYIPGDGDSSITQPPFKKITFLPYEEANQASKTL